jgi:hypothetical protein
VFTKRKDLAGLARSFLFVKKCGKGVHNVSHTVMSAFSSYRDSVLGPPPEIAVTTNLPE